MSEPNDQFWAVLTSKRDQGLAHITAMVERSGLDEFCGFLAKHVFPNASDDHAEADLVAHVVAHLAVIGAVDAMLAWKERHDE